MSDDGKSKKRSGWVVFGITATLAWSILAVWVWFGGAPSDVIDRAQPLTLATLGDFLSGIFAPVAFLWLFIAVMVQSQELALQREELGLTRREFEQTREVVKAQAEEAQRQAEAMAQQADAMRTQTARMRENGADDDLRSLLRGAHQFFYELIAGNRFIGTARPGTWVELCSRGEVGPEPLIGLRRLPYLLGRRGSDHGYSVTEVLLEPSAAVLLTEYRSMLCLLLEMLPSCSRSMQAQFEHARAPDVVAAVDTLLRLPTAPRTDN